MYDLGGHRRPQRKNAGAASQEEDEVGTQPHQVKGKEGHNSRREPRLGAKKTSSTPGGSEPEGEGWGSRRTKATSLKKKKPPTRPKKEPEGPGQKRTLRKNEGAQSTTQTLRALATRVRKIIAEEEVRRSGGHGKPTTENDQYEKTTAAQRTTVNQAVKKLPTISSHKWETRLPGGEKKANKSGAVTRW